MTKLVSPAEVYSVSTNTTGTSGAMSEIRWRLTMPAGPKEVATTKRSGPTVSTAQRMMPAASLSSTSSAFSVGIFRFRAITGVSARVGWSGFMAGTKKRPRSQPGPFGVWCRMTVRQPVPRTLLCPVAGSGRQQQQQERIWNVGIMDSSGRLMSLGTTA